MQAPEDSIPHSCGPAYVPESADILENVLIRLAAMVTDTVLTAEERAHSETFYKRLFQVNTSQHDPNNGETPLGLILDGGYCDVD